MSGRVIAIGSTDFSFKIITCYMTEAGDDPNYKGEFSNVETFGDVLFEI